jgi:hypothetical protein
MRDTEPRAAPAQEPEADADLARRHYWIAEMTAREGLPVDWRFVAVRMAQALAGLPEARLGEGDVLGYPAGWPADGEGEGHAGRDWKNSGRPHRDHDQADSNSPVGADQGAPRLRSGEER